MHRDRFLVQLDIFLADMFIVFWIIICFCLCKISSIHRHVASRSYILGNIENENNGSCGNEIESSIGSRNDTIEDFNVFRRYVTYFWSYLVNNSWFTIVACRNYLASRSHRFIEKRKKKRSKNNKSTRSCLTQHQKINESISIWWCIYVLYTDCVLIFQRYCDN